MKQRHWMITAPFLIGLAGCAPVEPLGMATPVQFPAPTATESTETEIVSGTLIPLNAAVEELAGIAKAQLAAKLDIAPEAVTVFSVDPAQWPDAGLGCLPDQPLEGDEPVAGYVLLLEAGGKLYTFHTDETDRVVLCDEAGPGEIYQPP